ncbi:MAG: hypothetical protein HSCHL_1643 [Hydrogenibacillus schlegelii]|uniref:Uncharacterized protein n=1 Tax=Hydrogenibacillus schlegelii TaxID=1484 RepID=A0A2T5GBQ0_HYDSH|nr:MAG: hypothetical protein HSCHL_1643 [Hydrogenibacillus schlegelii]
MAGSALLPWPGHPPLTFTAVRQSGGVNGTRGWIKGRSLSGFGRGGSVAFCRKGFTEGRKRRIQRFLPDARGVADPFYGLRDAGRRVDEARRVERRTGHRLPRRPLRKNEADLTERQAKKPAVIRRVPERGAVSRGQGRAARPLPGASLEEAKAIVDRIRFEAEGAGDAALVPWGRTLKRRKNEILADYPGGRRTATPRACTRRSNGGTGSVMASKTVEPQNS